MSLTVKTALQDLMERYLGARQAQYGSLPTQEYDPAWRSPCQVGAASADGLITWRPVEREVVADFSGLEHALEVDLHDDVKEYYGSFWSDGLATTCSEGEVHLILIWNEDDFQRLIGNIIGHALQQRRRKQPLTVFFACTEPDSELFLSIDNSDGQVLLERAGSAPIRMVAPSLAEFLQRLQPL